MVGTTTRNRTKSRSTPTSSSSATRGTRATSNGQTNMERCVGRENIATGRKEEIKEVTTEPKASKKNLLLKTKTINMSGSIHIHTYEISTYVDGYVYGTCMWVVCRNLGGG